MFIKIKKESAGTTHSLLYLAKETNVPQQYKSFLASLQPQFTLTRYPDAADGDPDELFDKDVAIDFLIKGKEVSNWIIEQMKK
jgi:HEPN domain-containing protein